MQLTDRQQWLAERRSGIGGSDIAAILGLSEYRSPLDVYEEKISIAPPDEKMSEPAFWGTRLESVVAEVWAERTGATVQRVNSILRHPSRPWAIGNIDRAIIDPGSRARVDRASRALLGAKSILEVKTASAYVADQWGDDNEPQIPTHYAAQGMWYLAISGLQVCTFAALLGGQRLVMRDLHADPETIANLLDAGERFWREHVEPRVPPPPRSAVEVARLFPRDSGDLIDATSDAALRDAIDALRVVRGSMDTLARQREQIEEGLKLAIGGASGIAIGGKPVVTWKATKDSTRVDWSAAAAELAGIPAAAAIIEKFTATTAGSRRFLLKESTK